MNELENRQALWKNFYKRLDDINDTDKILHRSGQTVITFVRFLESKK